MLAKLFQNVTVFLPKTLLSFVQMQEILETYGKSDFASSRRTFFGDGLKEIFIS